MAKGPSKNRGTFQSLEMVCVRVHGTTYKMGFDDLLVWLEGETFEVALPQSNHQGNRIYNEAAPILFRLGPN
jgi:hypothetical protein